MDEIEKLAAEIKTANPVRKMMLAQELVTLLVEELKNQLSYQHTLHNRVMRLETMVTQDA